MKNNKKGAAQGGAVNAWDDAAAADQLKRGQKDEGMGAAKGKKGDISDSTKAKEKKVVAESTKDYEGPGRMGYTQNFGPARQGGYAKGAAKVNSIMGKGPAQDGTIMSSTTKSDLLNLSRVADEKAKRKLHSERGTAGIVDSLKIDLKNPAAAVKKYGKNFTGTLSQIEGLSGNTIAGLEDGILILKVEM